MGREIGEAKIDRVEQTRHVQPAAGEPGRGAFLVGLDESSPCAFEVPDDTRRVATDRVDVGGGQLGQALEQCPIGRNVRAHPGRFE